MSTISGVRCTSPTRPSPHARRRFSCAPFSSLLLRVSFTGFFFSFLFFSFLPRCTGLDYVLSSLGCSLRLFRLYRVSSADLTWFRCDFGVLDRRVVSIRVSFRLALDFTRFSNLNVVTFRFGTCGLAESVLVFASGKQKKKKRKLTFARSSHAFLGSFHPSFCSTTLCFSSCWPSVDATETLIHSHGRGGRVCASVWVFFCVCVSLCRFQNRAGGNEQTMTATLILSQPNASNVQSTVRRYASSAAIFFLLRCFFLSILGSRSRGMERFRSFPLS